MHFGFWPVPDHLRRFYCVRCSGWTGSDRLGSARRQPVDAQRTMKVMLATAEEAGL